MHFIDRICRRDNQKIFRVILADMKCKRHGVSVNIIGKILKQIT